MRLIAAIILLLPAVAWGQIKDITRPPGLVELRPSDVPDGATYRWKAIYPFDLEYREYLTLDAKLRVCLLDLDQPGKYVVDLLVINWESKQSFDVRHIIEIEGDAPEPEPPTPGPDPKPPEPDDKLSGLAKAVRDEARKSVRAEVAGKLANCFETVASVIAAGGIHTLRDVQYALRVQLSDAGVKPADWSKLQAMIDSHLEKHGRDVKAAGLVFEEIVKGLQAI